MIYNSTFINFPPGSPGVDGPRNYNLLEAITGPKSSLVFSAPLQKRAIHLKEEKLSTGKKIREDQLVIVIIDDEPSMQLPIHERNLVINFTNFSNHLSSDERHNELTFHRI